MCTIVNKFANTGLVNISTANSNLDGTGTRGTVLTSPALTGNGTKINAITIKATGNTTEGMVRLFINSTLIQEVNIPAVTQTAVINAFQVTIDIPSLSLDPGDVLYASTQNPESFNIYANGVDWANCDCSDACNCSDVVINAHTGMVNIATGNPNLNGTGAIGTVFTAPPAGPTVYGSQIAKVDIKAIVTTTHGMIRLFLNNTLTNYLIWEVPIPALTQTNVQPAYRTLAIASIDLQAGYSLCASTQNSQSFNVITFASDITNCPCM